MKKLSLSLAIFLITILNATDISALSQKLKSTLCQYESIVSCTTNSYFEPNSYIKLDNNKILVFFNIYDPNSSLYHAGMYNATVIFDKNGNLKVQKYPITGSIEEPKRDPHGGIWLSHPWTIEGTSPSLSFSLDGNWQNIIFPKKRERDSIEWINICLLVNDIALKFDNGEKQSYWITSYHKAITKNPNWQEIPKEEFIKKRCLNAQAINNNWEEIESKDSLKFKRDNILIEIPKKIKQNSTLANLYSIQVGNFKLKKNLDIVSKQLNDIIGYPIISKEFQDKSYKLFLGTFHSQREAKNALERLKRKYQKNRYINEAFIVELPPY
jgi:hypothetical protein